MNQITPPNLNQRTIAQTVQDACIKAAKEGFRDASMRGLCSEGAMEAAMGAIQSLDIEKILADVSRDEQ